jgi:hypothetical protein
MANQLHDGPAASGAPVERVLCALLGLALLLPGCGVQAYEQRLQDTNELFAYWNSLDENLSRPWAQADFGLEMRVPKPFQLMARPQPAEVDESGQPIALDEDKRQPLFLGIEELPGLIDAWRATLPISESEGMPAYLYVLGNHQRFLDRQLSEGEGAEPGTFLEDLELLLQNTLNVTIQDSQTGDRDNVRYRETIPRQEKYAVPKEFTAISLLTPEEMQRDLGGHLWRIQVYEHRADPIQVAVVLIYPAAVSDRPVDRLKLALETLKVANQPPRAPRPGEPETGGPARRADF